MQKDKNEKTSKAEKAVKIISETGGIAGTSDFIVNGIEKWDLTRLCRKGILKRVQHGYYQLPGNRELREINYLAKILPEAIIFLHSALFYYGYIKTKPKKWTIAVPRTVSQTRLKKMIIPIKPYFSQPDIFNLGKTAARFKEDNSEATLLIYDRERTICDCFRYRTKLEKEFFSEVLRQYCADYQKNTARLREYAKKLGILTKTEETMMLLGIRL